MNQDTISLTNRDKIALDIYKRAVSGYQRFFPIKMHAEVAEASYHAADAFLTEMAKQSPAPIKLAVPVTNNERETVAPVVGKRYYTRNGRCAMLIHVTPATGNYTAEIAGSSQFLVYPDGHANDPANDLVSECPF